MSDIDRSCALIGVVGDAEYLPTPVDVRNAIGLVEAWRKFQGFSLYYMRGIKSLSVACNPDESEYFEFFEACHEAHKAAFGALDDNHKAALSGHVNPDYLAGVHDDLRRRLVEILGQ